MEAVELQAKMQAHKGHDRTIERNNKESTNYLNECIT